MAARIRHDAPPRAIPMDDHGLLANADRPDIIRGNAGNSVKGVSQHTVSNIRCSPLRPSGTIPVQGERSIRRTISLADRPDVVRSNRYNAVQAVADGTGVRA